MVKSYWIAVAAVAGVLVGTFVGRLNREAPRSQDPDPARPVTKLVAPGPKTREMVSAQSIESAQSSRSRTENPVPDGQAAARTAAKPDGAIVGFELNGPAPGHFENLESMHDQFLREQRDDSWAYLREAEFENSMVMETSAGKFNKDRIECRATLCELELSARGEQVPQLKKWYDAMSQQGPDPNAPVMLRMASFSDETGRATVRMAWQKPARVLPSPN